MVYGMNPEPGRISTILVSYRYKQADMAELVYAHDSKSCGETHVGSSPTVGTTIDFVSEVRYILRTRKFTAG